MKEEISQSSFNKSYMSSKGTEIIKKENLEDVNISFKTYFKYFFYTPLSGLLFIIGILINFAGFGSVALYEYSILYWVKDL